MLMGFLSQNKPRQGSFLHTDIRTYKTKLPVPYIPTVVIFPIFPGANKVQNIIVAICMLHFPFPEPDREPPLLR